MRDEMIRLKLGFHKMISFPRNKSRKGIFGLLLATSMQVSHADDLDLSLICSITHNEVTAIIHGESVTEKNHYSSADVGLTIAFHPFDVDAIGYSESEGKRQQFKFAGNYQAKITGSFPFSTPVLYALDESAVLLDFDSYVRGEGNYLKATPSNILFWARVEDYFLSKDNTYRIELDRMTGNFFVSFRDAIGFHYSYNGKCKPADKALF
ncbi:hypothetical protein Q6D67_05140 [Haliea sp. E1-2-M8]|uniref:hypothetical protein n=1 Tax=Haliea sp. E1-2-M8 TaxID=3064706 RepID=UPI002724AC10|nr:hypothetical protein [Haliea sp. E1-2-M8]MDO8861082.1 hypothetical protein [Haliea sp. E1-2-M8]